VTQEELVLGFFHGEEFMRDGYEREKLRWNGWGSRAVAFDTRGHDRKLWELIGQAVGLERLPETKAVSLERVELPAIALSLPIIEALGTILSPERVLVDAYERSFHALGRSYHDLLRLRSGKLESAPDVVVYPGNATEILDLLSFCDRERIAVVPFGGGSSVVGGVEATKTEQHVGVLTLDTTRMNRVLDVDPISRTATVESGVYGPQLEEELRARGFTLGHFPQSFEYSTLGGWIAARSAGQLSNRYGTASDFLVSAKLATPRGELRTLSFPASAAGPDINRIIAGSEGTLGVITEATVKVHPLPGARDFAAFLFRDFEVGVEAARQLVQADVGASMIRLSDAHETHFFEGFRQALDPGRAHARWAQRALDVIGFRDAKSVMLVGFEGDRASVRGGLARTLAIATRSGGLFVGRKPGQSWWNRRFEMPYLRDPMMDRGLGVDTLETSTEWANVPRLYRAVRSALEEAIASRAASTRRKGLVMTHLSHSYADGASLYFTFVFARDPSGQLEREIAEWRVMKENASRAIVLHGGTISHHHGVGIDHAHWLLPEKGQLGMDMLGAIKSTIDPHGIMNPGKLL
jgi:alkyldihydroxyacetonephosphate synthase